MPIVAANNNAPPFASNFKIEPAHGKTNRRDQTIDIVISRTEYSERFFTGIRGSLPRLYDLWRGVFTGRFHPHKNNVHIPLIFGTVWADAARKVATSLNRWPILYFQGYGPEDAATARRREQLISAQMKDARAFEKEITTFVRADLYGSATSQIMWDHREEDKIIEDIARMPLSGEIVRQIKKVNNVVTFDGPNYENVDRLDFFPAPNFRTIEDMPWVVRRYFLDIDDVRALVARGIFDKVEGARLEREGGVNSQYPTDEVLIRRFQIRLGMTDEAARWMDKYSRPIEILEMWGKVPSELAPDGVMQRVVTVANRRYLMRSKPLPFWHGKKPFINFSPMPDPHYFDAPGKAEVAEKLQIVANRYMNQTLDAADLVIDPMWFYDRNKGMNTRNMFARPGKMIGVDGDPNRIVAPMQANLQGIAVGDAKIGQMREAIQGATGIIEDAVQGLSGGDRQTAREFVGRREAAGTRLMLESRIYEETYLEPLGNMFSALNKQFLQTPRSVMILGDSATIDPVTQAQIPTSRETIQGSDLVNDYAARAVGSTAAISQAVRQQNDMQFLQILGSIPGMMGAINSVNLLRQVMRDLEFTNINELLNQNVAQNPALAQQIGQATGGEGGAENVPENSEVLAALEGLQQQGPGLPGDAAGALAPSQ